LATAAEGPRNESFAHVLYLLCFIIHGVLPMTQTAIIMVLVIRMRTQPKGTAKPVLEGCWR
jgi:hypothetical protein